MNRRDITSLVISLALHGALVALLLAVPLELPDDFEFSLPAEVEFGVVEELAVEAPPEAPPESEPEKAPARAGTKKAPRERPEPEPEPEPAEVPDRRAPDGEPPAGRIPAGSQIALRIDMAKVRGSRLAAPARRLIAQIPDWHLLASGSGIDPVDELDRLLIATPDPRRRDLIVLAGKSVGDASTIRAATAAIAESRGETAEFREEGGVPVAPWHSIDPTERSIAILGPRHFAITRPATLGTVLAMTRHRERRGAEDGLERARGADALLSLADGDAISIEVENVASYARRLPCPTPEKGRASIRETESGVAIEARVFHASAEDAARASECWEGLRQRYAGHLFVRLLGLGRALEDASVALDDDEVAVSAALTDSQARQLLEMIGGQIARLTGFRPPRGDSGRAGGGDTAQADPSGEAAPAPVRLPPPASPPPASPPPADDDAAGEPL